MMASLVFRALDRHVVGGLADHPAIADERGSLSYAQLLHESACVAGAIGHLGVVGGTPVSIELPHSRELVIAVLACARLGAVPHATGLYVFGGTPPQFRTPDSEVEWTVLMRAGRAEPAPAPDRDADGYEDLLRAEHGELIDALIAGRTI